MTLKSLSILLTSFVLTMQLNGVALAQTPASTPSGEVTDILKERIRKAAENQQVQGASTAGIKKGFIGTVKRISEETMTFETTRGTLVVSLSQVTLVQNNRTISAKDVEIDNSAVIMGFQTGDDFQPRRILISANSLRPEVREIHIGTVQKIDRTSITLTPRGTQESKVFALLAANKTQFLDRSQDTITASSIETGQDVILVTTAEDTNSQAVKDSVGRVKILYSLADSPQAQ